MPDFKELHTSPELLTALTAGAAKHPSQSELFEQRVSFIYGSMKPDSDVTRERIRKVLEEGVGAECDPVRTHGN